MNQTARLLTPPVEDDESDMAAIGRAMNEDRKERHAGWKVENTALLTASGLAFRTANNGESLLFRERGKPAVDFYPSTGRWRIPAMNRTMGGHAQRFLTWYAGEKW